MANVEPLLVDFHDKYPNQDLPNPANEEKNATGIALLNVYLLSRTWSLNWQNSFWTAHQISIGNNT